jgi:hypothetical protein
MVATTPFVEERRDVLRRSHRLKGGGHSISARQRESQLSTGG